MASKVKAEELTAKKLKGILWETLRKLQAKRIRPQQADAIAIQSREIVRVVRSQQAILGQAGRQMTQELIDYAEK